MPHQTGEFHQLSEPEERAPLSNDHFGIRGDKVSPLRRNGASRPLIDAQQEPLARPVTSFADADELTAGERVEGMRYADKLLRCNGKVCIPG
jgi:hypothetical protein